MPSYSNNSFLNNSFSNATYSSADFTNANHLNDQAAGLRRLMVSPQPRVLSIISAAKTQPARLMSNLAASLCCDGSDVLIVQNSPFPSSVKLKAPLIDFIHKPIDVTQMTMQMDEGYYVAALLRHQQESALDFERGSLLDALFRKLAMQYQFVLVETKLNLQQQLPIKTLNLGQIVIHLTSRAEDIKQAYQLIKQISTQHIHANIESQPFGILVTDTTDEKAKIVFRNIAQVAKRYLKLELELIGVVPADDALAKAAKLGCSVINAFPLANASAAFKTIAKHLDYRIDDQNKSTYLPRQALDGTSDHARSYNNRLLSGSGIFEGAM